MSRFSVIYFTLPAVGSGIRPVEAADAFEAEQIVQRNYPGAITASLSPSITDQDEQFIGHYNPRQASGRRMRSAS